MASVIVLFLVDRPNLPLSVETTVGADTVRRLRLVALCTQANRRRSQGVVGPPLGGAGFRVSAFRVWHSLVAIEIS
jgi:hypothetical protein